MSEPQFAQGGVIGKPVDIETRMPIRARRAWIVRFACFVGKRLAYISPSLAAQIVNLSQRFLIMEYYTPLTGWQRLPKQQWFYVGRV